MFCSLPLSLLLIAVCTLAACDTGEVAADRCSQAEAHLESCFGAGGATEVGRCTSLEADQILAQDCDALYTSMLDTKTDSGVDRQVKSAIRDAIQLALVKGIEAAFVATLDALGLDLLSDTLFYVSFYSADTADEAQTKAAEIADILDGEPEYAPVTYAFDDHHAVLHGPCPVALAGLAETLGVITLGYPTMLKAVGGTMDKEVEEDSVTLRFHLPLGLVTTTEDLEADLGCGK
jgi:hypothetical protein